MLEGIGEWRERGRETEEEVEGHHYTRPDSTGGTVCHPGNDHCSDTDLFQHNNIVEQQLLYFNQSSCLLDTKIVLLPGTHDVSGDRLSNAERIAQGFCYSGTRGGGGTSPWSLLISYATVL